MNVDNSCAPICKTNSASALPSVAPSSAPSGGLGSDCASPMFVTVCGATPEYQRNLVVKCDPATGATVFISFIYLENAAPGTPPTIEYYSSGGGVWAGAPATLIDCDVDLESDPEQMCNNGVQFLRWYVKKNGQPTGVTFDTAPNGTPYTAVGPVVIGSCAMLPATIVTDGITLAGPVRAATPAFAGALASVDITARVAAAAATGRLQSFTVTAFATTPGLLGLTANQVRLNMVSLGNPNFSGNINLNDGETRSFSVERDQDQRLIASAPTVVVTGNAYAHITWTFAI